MDRLNLEKILSCPVCRLPIIPKSIKGKCKKCGFEYYKQDGIWHFLHLPSKKNSKSRKEYELMHKDYFGGPNDGSYEILAAISKGNKTVDIACGEGLIERLAPETVGVEFSLNALKKAKQGGAKNLVLASAQNLPFVANSFDVAICAGSLEQFENPQTSISEMARVSKIQVLTVHREFDFPFARVLRKLVTKTLGVKDQPIEKPLRWTELEEILGNAKLNIVFKGFWTFPVNFGKVAKPLPVFKNIPSCFFVITTKK